MRISLQLVLLLGGAAGLFAAGAGQSIAPPADAGYVRPDGAIRIVCGNRGMGRILEDFGDLFSRTHPGVRFAIE